MRTPDPGRWLSEKVSQRYVADYKPFSFVDGEGVRCSLYLSGCLFACEGCFNEAAWNFKYGEPYSKTLENRILADLSLPYVQGLSLLGGEPFLNTEVALQLVSALRAEFGSSKDIWCWSGYTFEQLQLESEDKQQLLAELDVLVDGRFEILNKKSGLQFRGSSNQRVLDVKASLQEHQAVVWDGLLDANQSYELLAKQSLI